MKANHISIGKFNIDVITTVNRIPEVDSSETTDVLEIVPGGSATNYAVTATTLGHSSVLVAPVAKDDITRTLLNTLASYGVGLEYVMEVNEKPNVTLIFLRRDGSISIIRRTATSLSQEMLGKLRDAVNLFDVVHFASISPNYVIKPEKGLLTYDPGQYAGKLGTTVDVLFCNEREYEKVSSYDARLTVIKMGKKGARTEGLENCEVEAYPAEKINDTTGAGDVFDATFNVLYYETKKVNLSLRYAVTAASMKLGKIGGIFPISREEIEAKLRDFTPRVRCK
ncbi:sugar kinase [Sulfolobales archaeon HS-7]|nr:sugar kinase [Sulfolobales archaeon HS-7]